jgi:magnesium chelatase family protein
MGIKEIERHCRLTDDASRLMKVSLQKMHLSARAYHRILKVARTIADLADEKTIGVAHLAEAIQYRPRRLIN